MKSIYLKSLFVTLVSQQYHATTLKPGRWEPAWVIESTPPLRLEAGHGKYTYPFLITHSDLYKILPTVQQVKRITAMKNEK